MKDGRMTYKQDVAEGLENAPQGFIELVRGENFGKLLIRVPDE